MSKIVLILIKESILCEETKKMVTTYIQKYPSIELETIYFDDINHKKSEFPVNIEGFPCFLIYDKTNKLIRKLIGGDNKTISKAVEIALKNC